MDETEALRSIENALRLAIRDVLGVRALDAPGAPDREKLESRRLEEQKRRDAVRTSTDLIDYADIHHLVDIIAKNWQDFKDVFHDKKRTDAFFEIVQDVRNTIAHSRDLAPHERELVSGIAGHIRNSVALHRGQLEESLTFYPRIESVTDNFGTSGTHPDADRAVPRSARIEVGDVLTFSGRAWSAREKAITWWLFTTREQIFYSNEATLREVATGDRVQFNYCVSEDDVHESFGITVRIASVSRYHRYMRPGGEAYDDASIFRYAVSPPHDE